MVVDVVVVAVAGDAVAFVVALAIADVVVRRQRMCMVQVAVNRKHPAEKWVVHSLPQVFL